jgi:hypothetical protein
MSSVQVYGQEFESEPFFSAQRVESAIFRTKLLLDVVILHAMEPNLATNRQLVWLLSLQGMFSSVSSAAWHDLGCSSHVKRTFG